MVVGIGNSGADIAVEISRCAEKVRHVGIFILMPLYLTSPRVRFLECHADVTCTVPCSL